MTHHSFHPKIVETVKKRGFTEFSEIQKKAIPSILKGEDILIIAPTGTGKTETAMIPVFNHMLSSTGSGFTTLYITPLRALNRDIQKRMEWWCHELGLTIGVRHGDTTQHERRKQTLYPPNLLITTPETIQAMFMGSVIRNHFKGVQYVVIDEIHDLAGTKRGAQLVVALERIVSYAGDFQRIGLSATVGNPKDIVTYLSPSKPVTIVEVTAFKQISLNYVITGEQFEQQVKTVEKCIKNEPSSLLFVNTRSTAEALGHALIKRDHLFKKRTKNGKRRDVSEEERGEREEKNTDIVAVDVHHGSLSRDMRIEAEERFKEGRIKCLICTSSMELGIDIGHVGHVFQFGSPREVHRIVQRVGRAGHQIGLISYGTLIATGFDDLLESLVIGRKAHAGEIEPITPITFAGDVLANQIAAMIVEYGEIPEQTVIDIIKRSSAFYGEEAVPLTASVLEQMQKHYLVRREGNLLIKTGRARRYLTGNLSMIADERKFPVVDIVSRKIVGSLDESFVLTHLHTGAIFIARGHLWRILEMEEGVIRVEPAKNAQGDPPAWEGEQIPVPFAVAQEVGKLRRTRNIEVYTDSEICIRYAAGYFTMLDANRTKVPTDILITLEKSQDGIVINLCAGHQTNEAIGRVLSVLLSARFGSTIGMEIDAYRILLHVPSEVTVKTISELFLTTDPAHINAILKLALKRTSLFRWKLVQIAKKFGAIDPDADYERMSIHRLSEIFSMRAIQNETYRELFSRYMDVWHAEEIFSRLQAGEIEIASGPPSMIGAAGLFSSRDQVPPPTADQAVIATLKHRLMSQEIILACMYCKKWKTKTTIERAPEQPVCPRCQAKLVAAIKPYEAENINILKKKEKTNEEKAIEKRFMMNANIILSSGKKAMIVLAAKGVGPDTASRILAKQYEGDALYKEILVAERNYIRTHKFW
jgi:ATP-dependent Lhr-like helicase